MESVYQLPFERFQRHVPCGTPAQVADALAGYVDAGCTSFTLIARADDPAAAVDGVAEVKAMLA
jgi:alkanesulfonate monooxygenase SsuD/methylene tetrahydromethanopterin reductase-like flavin-dependent oxidoreductase (luciferase family)